MEVGPLSLAFRGVVYVLPSSSENMDTGPTYPVIFSRVRFACRVVGRRKEMSSASAAPQGAF